MPQPLIASLVAVAVAVAALSGAEAQTRGAGHGPGGGESRGQGAADAAPILIMPDQMKWLSVVSMPGVSEAWMVGGSDKPGPYVVRRHIEQGGQVPPRIDQQTIFLTVLSGEVYLGNDDEVDPRSARRLPAGTFVVIPANSYHYLWARHTEAVVQEWGTLPGKAGAPPSSTNGPLPPSHPSP
jgi:quercetin dioxygenase-like cupin family protein